MTPDDDTNMPQRHRHGASWDANGSPVDDIHPLQSAKPSWLRWVLLAVVVFWAGVAVAVKACV